MVEIKNITEPQRIYIFGISFEGEQESFSTTDDYDTVDIFHNGDFKAIMDIDGFCHVYTEEEYQAARDTLYEDGAGGADVIILDDFVGTISVDMRYVQGPRPYRMLENSLLLPDVDINDYLRYQTIEDADDNEPNDASTTVVVILDGTFTSLEKSNVEEFLEA
jgi:hypothetical protein